MQILNGNSLDLSGSNAEVISVSISASGTAAAASMSLNGAPFSGSSFTLNSGLTFILVVFVIFSGTSGGKYSVTLSGSSGGTASHTIAQLPNQASNTIAFTIDVH